MPTEDRRKGKQLPIPVTPLDTVCFSIQIPNAVQYRAAFLGQINVLGQALTWDHPTDGTVCTECEEAAQLWRNAIYNASWSDECGGNVNCDDVAACIATHLGTQEAIGTALGSSEAIQQAIADLIASNPDIAQDITNIYRYGTPMTQAQLETPIVPLVNCDNDKSFGMISEMVDFLHQNNIDFLEIAEVGTNTRERLSSLISAIPLIETLPFDDMIAFLDKLETEIYENYNAQWTTAVRNDYRCGIFCLAQEKPDCEVTFELLIEYFENRIGASLEPANFFTSVLQYFLLGTWSGTTVVDIMMLIQLGVWAQATAFVGLTYLSLQSVGFLGANNPDNDWVLLCENCVPPFEWDVVIFTVSGRPGGTWVQTGEKTAEFTATRNTALDNYYRVAFQFGETGGKARFVDIDLQPSVALASSGMYQPNANPKNLGTSSGIIPGVGTDGVCYGGMLYQSLSPFKVVIEFMDDCP